MTYTEEDDTFKKLSQLPFDDMKRLVKEFNHRYHHADGITYSNGIGELLTANGWTVDEYSTEHVKFTAYASRRDRLPSNL